MSPSKSLIVIVNYRSAELTLDALNSLLCDIGRESERPWRVVVTDNASPDGSGARLVETVRANGWTGWCEVRLLPRNGGFAYGNNQAFPPGVDRDPAKPHIPERVLLLNPDTVVRPGAIAELMRFMDDHPQAGIVGSRLEDPDGTPQVSAFNFPTVLSEVEGGFRLGVVTRLLRKWMIAPPWRNDTHRCHWVAGACMLVRREVFEDIGMMDEGYFMYYEEVDFCLRAARKGWETWYVPAARVVHLVGQSSGVTDTKKPARRLPSYWFESRKRYFTKNHGIPYRILADLGWASGHIVHRLLRLLRGGKNADPPRLLRDFLTHAVGGRTG